MINEFRLQIERKKKGKRKQETGNGTAIHEIQFNNRAIWQLINLKDKKARS